MNTLLQENVKIENKDQLTEYFKSGFKTTQKLGVEYEKLPVKRDYTSVEFFFENGILDFLNKFNKEEHTVPFFENDIMLGLYSNKGSITLEPGCQLELSLKPFENIFDIEKELVLYNAKTSKIASEFGIKFLALGNQPLSVFDNIKVIPKNRYAFMTKYLKEQATLPYVMMRETAGIQVSIDYKNEEDAINKLSCALKLSPFLSALFVNSPFRNGKLTEYKSFRMNAWLNTDNKRCGLVSKKLLQYKPDFSFSDYVEILLDVPMIFNDKYFVGNKTFREYFNENKFVEEDVWKTHLSLYFPDVRLKNYIEIRNHDCQKIEYALAIPAIYKGIMYADNGIEKINDLLKNFNYYDYEFVRQNAPRFGINFNIKDIEVSNIIKDILFIAKEGLYSFDKNEIKYLEPIEELINDNITPADIIIRNFNGSWNKDIRKLIEFSEIN